MASLVSKAAISGAGEFGWFDGGGRVEQDRLSGVPGKHRPGAGRQEIRDLLKVIIDAGHGGHDPGAIGHGRAEEDITLSVARLVERELEARNVWCALTRRDDVFIPLRARAEKANAMEADLFVSIHVNSARNPGAHGFEVFHYSGSSEGRDLAWRIHGAMVQASAHRISRGVKQENFAVLRHTNMPAALVEIGFISNQRDLERFDELHEQQELAAAIASGILP